VLEGKATEQELREYKEFVVHLADKVAHAHREHSEDAVSEAERAAMAAIAQALG
jgi:hypothetical protein